MKAPITDLTVSEIPQNLDNRWGNRKPQIVAAIRAGSDPSDIARRLGITREWVRAVWVAETGNPLPRPSLSDRFWLHVNQNGPINPRRPELGPCWMWTGSSYRDPKTGANTYGQIMVDGKRIGAHRASFLMHGGTVPEGHDVLHFCDTKPCVRPTHLGTGTRSENLLDGFANPANAGVCAGENNGRALLDWDKVHAIRATSKVYGYQPILARQFGVSQGQISQILAGKKWPESTCPIHGDAPFRKTVAA